MQSLGSLLHHTREKWFLEAPELQVLWNDAKQDYNDTFVSPTAKKIETISPIWVIRC